MEIFKNQYGFVIVRMIGFKFIKFIKNLFVRFVLIIYFGSSLTKLPKL